MGAVLAGVGKIALVGMIVISIVSILTSIVNMLFTLMTDQLLDKTDKLEWFEEVFPILPKISDVIVIIAVALSMYLVLWTLFKHFFSPDDSKIESPLMTLLRVLIFVPMTLMYRSILNVLLDIKDGFITVLTDGITQATKISTELPENFFDIFVVKAVDGTVDGTIMNTTAGLVVLAILGCTVFISFFKFFLELIEQYVIVGVLTYTAPLAIACGASHITAQVTKSFFRMYCGHLVLLVLGRLSYEVFRASVCARVDITSPSSGSLIAWCLVMIAYLRIVQHWDSILQRLGFEVQTTGTGMFGEIAGTLAMARIAMMGGPKVAGKGRPAGGGTGGDVSGQTTAFQKLFSGGAAARGMAALGSLKGKRQGAAAGNVANAAKAFTGARSANDAAAMNRTGAQYMNARAKNEKALHGNAVPGQKGFPNTPRPAAEYKGGKNFGDSFMNTLKGSYSRGHASGVSAAGGPSIAADREAFMEGKQIASAFKDVPGSARIGDNATLTYGNYHYMNKTETLPQGWDESGPAPQSVVTASALSDSMKDGFFTGYDAHDGQQGNSFHFGGDVEFSYADDKHIGEGLVDYIDVRNSEGDMFGRITNAHVTAYLADEIDAKVELHDRFRDTSDQCFECDVDGHHYICEVSGEMQYTDVHGNPLNEKSGNEWVPATDEWQTAVSQKPEEDSNPSDSEE